MCGICGIWGVDKEESVERMISVMDHRGPDDRGIYRGPNVSLGMTRLAILDLSSSGHQPMANFEQTVWIVYNGEVYNFQTERQLLETKGYRFSSASDTEVVLRMYEYYGDDFLKRLRGMFALAIYDRRGGAGKERLLLARDPLGIKPLLYARGGGQLVFASEMKALLASGLVSPEIDAVGLRMLLTHGSVFQPHSIIRNVKMLSPGHYMLLTNDTFKLERYWQFSLNRHTRVRGQPYEEQVELMRSAVEESVRSQMISDTPVGAFLSGGVDSSILVAMMTRHARGRIKTFSVGFEAEGESIDESQDALRTAHFLGTEHNHVLVTGREVQESIAQIARALDQPSVDGVNSYFVSKAARQGVTVAISGTGGDEVFAGYPWFIQMALRQHRERTLPFWKKTAKAALATLGGLSAWNHNSQSPYLQRLLRMRDHYGFLGQYAHCYSIFGSAGAADLMAPDLRAAGSIAQSIDADLQDYDELTAGSTLERVTALCLRRYTCNQLLRDIDAVSMAHSLEVRVPFLDTEVLDLSLSMPDSTKLSRLPAKYDQLHTYRELGAKRILIDIGRSLLPKDFDLKPKRGFSMPFTHWLKGLLRETLEDTLSESTVRRRGLLDPSAVAKIRSGFLAGDIDWSRPWLLMMLELWCREALDGHADMRRTCVTGRHTLS
jgi:asparagine synthase (glutamine-hydrolysing)